MKKKTMKFSLAALGVTILLGAASCKKVLEFRPLSFDGTLEAVEDAKGDTKSVTRYGYRVLWENKDQVYAKTHSNLGRMSSDDVASVFTLTNGAGTTKGQFVQSTPNPSLSGAVDVFHPASLGENMVWPGEQTSKTVVPMYAYDVLTENPTQSFKFTALGSVMHIIFNSRVQGITLKAIRLTADQPLSGPFKVVSEGSSYKAEIDEYGSKSIILRLGSGTVLGPSAYRFYIHMPSGDYTNVKLTFIATDGRATIVSLNTGAKPLTIDHNKVETFSISGSFKDFDSDFNDEAADLSETGTANCYIVSKPGAYRFDATKKGNSSEPVGAIASAEVIWESFGSEVQPSVGDIIKDVTVQDGIVSFNSTGNNGNAVIAVKDAGNKILWSWHIWACNDFDPNATAQVYNNDAGIVMDRNLGATSVTKGDVNTLGLIYQWGRKDPFLNIGFRQTDNLFGSTYDETTKAKSTTTWPSPVPSDSNNGTFDYVMTHPTTFVYENTGNQDWLYTGDSSVDKTRWGVVKSMYDPCPTGWKIPDNDLWSRAFNRSGDWTTSSNWDSTHFGMDFGATDWKLGTGEVWYPCSGSLTYNSDLNSLQYYGTPSYWACGNSDGSSVTQFCFIHTGKVIPASVVTSYADAMAVRCVKDIAAPAPEPVDLSAAGTANCYIVSKSGRHHFDATKKGNTTESVGAIASAEVIWESFGNGVHPEVGDIINDVTVQNGIVSFNATGTSGNAVIAVKDAGNNILWSWHIWACNGYDPDASAHVYNNNAGTVMDRNLGATSARMGDIRTRGLLYQWGRKDPFLNVKIRQDENLYVTYYDSTTQAESTTAWPSAVTSNSSNGTVGFTVKNPTTFVYKNSSNNDWFYTGNESTDVTRWQSSKGMYDPCPAGWRVPDMDLWSNALGKGSEWTVSSNWNSTFYGMDFGATDRKLGTGMIWYPDSGFLTTGIGGIQYGSSPCYWSCGDALNHCATFFAFNFKGSVKPVIYTGNRADAMAVRCVKEASAPAPVPVDLSAEGTANCYIVNKYGPYQFDATKKGNTNESVGAIASAEVIWESFGNDIRPEVGDVVRNVSVKDGIVSFTASGTNGNAVIAVKDAGGDILWSWHIWAYIDFYPNVTAHKYNNNAGMVMDRNLGATSVQKSDVRTLGLLYQWGRKDPFLGLNEKLRPMHIAILNNTTQAASTTTWPSAVASDSSNGTIDFAVKHPTTFILENSNNNDWFYTGNITADPTRWTSSKSMYDPCPVGWRVPDADLWRTAFNTNSVWQSSSDWDSIHYGMNFGATTWTLGTGLIWYPAAGTITTAASSLNISCTTNGYWSCNIMSMNSSSCLQFSETGQVDPYASGYRAYGMAVRCVKDIATPAPEPEPETVDLSADGTANCYIVNKYGPCKFSAAMQGIAFDYIAEIASAEVIWESFGNDVKPAKGDIVSNVTLQDNFVTFTASGKDGNAVIAVKNAGGDILWSWHIWVYKGFDPVATAQVYKNDAGLVMDRNLGATSVTKGDVRALGLLYQWGRKDPFLNVKEQKGPMYIIGSLDDDRAESTIAWPSAVESNSSNGTIGFTVKNPTTFVYENSSNHDWYYTGNDSTDNTRWKSSKGAYDPCPRGWKVPDSDLWAKALMGPYGIIDYSCDWDSTNYGTDFGGKLGTGVIWYPGSGHVVYRLNALQTGCQDNYYWSCGDSYFGFNSVGNVTTSAKPGSHADGMAVRCVKK